MLPILFNIFGIPVHTYGVLIASGFLLSVYFTKKEAIRVGINGTAFVDMAFWCLLIGMLGARILFIITRWNYFAEYPLEMLQVWEGGLVFYGGPILCIPYILYFCRKNKIEIWKLLDICALGIPIAHAIGRLGCLSSGCCYGRPTHSSWGIILNSPLVDAHLHDIKLHPTQLYEFVALMLLFLFLKKRIRTKKYDGEVTFIYVFSYAIIRTVVEYFRGDEIRGFLIPDVLSTSQFISLLGAIVAFIFWRKRLKELKP